MGGGSEGHLDALHHEIIHSEPGNPTSEAQVVYSSTGGKDIPEKVAKNLKVVGKELVGHRYSHFLTLSHTLTHSLSHPGALSLPFEGLGLTGGGPRLASHGLRLTSRGSRIRAEGLGVMVENYL